MIVFKNYKFKKLKLKREMCLIAIKIFFLQIKRWMCQVEMKIIDCKKWAYSQIYKD